MRSVKYVDLNRRPISVTCLMSNSTSLQLLG